MKRLQYLLILLGTVLFLSSCKDNENNEIEPSTITDVETFSLPGEIGITWTKTEPVTFEYLKILYYDKLTKKDVVRLASRYADTVIIPDTRKKYGDYEFTIQPFSITDVGGKSLTINGTSEAAPKIVRVANVVALTLDADKLYTDAQEPRAGHISGLVDKNKDTFFHSAWSIDKGPMPHYVVVDLGKQIKGFKFDYLTRNHGSPGNHPKKMNVYVSNSFDGSTYDVSAFTPVAELTGLPNGPRKTYSSERYIVEEGCRYIWFQVRESHGGTKFFSLAELEIEELELEIIDPEAPEKHD